MMPGAIKPNLLARLLKLTPRRVRQLADEGIVVRAGRGAYDFTRSVQGYVTFLAERADAAQTANGDPADRARLVRAKADIAEMEAERQRDSLVPVADVDAAWRPVVAAVRDRLMAVGGDIAPLVVNETHLDTCRNIIDTFIKKALADVAGIEVVAAVGDPSSHKPANRSPAYH